MRRTTSFLPVNGPREFARGAAGKGAEVGHERLVVDSGVQRALVSPASACGKATSNLTQFFHPLTACSMEPHLRSLASCNTSTVPCAERRARHAIERLSAARCASFLAVLKRFEHASSGLLGFPLPGWTLALDIPATASGLPALLDDLDELVAEAGGAYLSKDARLAPGLVPVMYPTSTGGAEIRCLDPRHVLRQRHGSATRPDAKEDCAS